MTEEEKQAYNFFKKCNEKDLENFDYFSEPSKLQIKYMETVLNLIEKQQAETNKYKEMYAVSVADRVNSAFKQEHKNNEDLEMLYKGCQIELENKEARIKDLEQKLNAKEILSHDMPEDTEFVIMTRANYERNFGKM